MDNCIIKESDLCGNFFLTEEDIGKKRSEVCWNKLQ